MNLHASYQFKTPSGSFGFGHVIIENINRVPNKPSDIADLQVKIIDADPDLAGATIRHYRVADVLSTPAMSVRIIVGDALEQLRILPDESVHCVISSPPYWGAQRDYGNAGQLGMEKTPEGFVAALVAVFREARRVLRADGVLWLVIGDSYAASGKGGGGKMMMARGHQWGHRAHLKGWRSPPPGYKQKDLVGVPWLLAMALRQDGWTLRRDIVWDKGSATEPTRADRPSGSHEMVFLFSRALRYSFDSSCLPHGTVWRVTPEGCEGHGAAFPPALIKPCVLAGSPEGGTILDCFGGASTTGLVADRNGRNAILIELNPEYAEIGRARLVRDGGMFMDVKVEPPG